MDAENKGARRIWVDDLFFDTEEVDGSSPFGPTIFLNDLQTSSACAVRAPHKFSHKTTSINFGRIPVANSKENCHRPIRFTDSVHRFPFHIGADVRIIFHHAGIHVPCNARSTPMSIPCSRPRVIAVCRKSWK